jgi:hypothetical protein
MHCFLLFFVLILFSGQPLFAQIPVEVLVGHRQTQHEFFFFKDIDSTNKFNLFSIANFAVDYKDLSRNSSSISSQLTYNLNQNWGISSGALFNGKEFSPLVAVSYQYGNKKGDFYMNLFPTMILKEKPEFELFGLLFYAPKLTDKWSIFSQLIFGTIVSNKFNRHLFSYQQIRLGLGYKNLFQFGIGFDHNIIGNGKGENYTNNIGIFIRKEL